MYIGKFESSGSKNSFYKLKGKKYGFKSFPTKNLAKFAHLLQSKLSLHHLAPRVYGQVGKIRIPQYFLKLNGKCKKELTLSDWGYLTEIAEQYICEDENCCGECSDDCECQNYNTISELLDNMYDEGVEYIDAHPGNFGWVKRGKFKLLVAIDFGRESIGEVSDIYPQLSYEEFYSEEEYA
jgi:hypothetical protein